MPIRPRRRTIAALIGGLIALSVPALATAPAGASTGDITDRGTGTSRDWGLSGGSWPDGP
jgi:hypothetical protein